MEERREPKLTHRLIPCPRYDVSGMECWLSDMAKQGLLLQKDGFFAGTATFEKGSPQRVKYRLQPAEKSTGMWADYNGDPDARELHTDPEVQVLAMSAMRKRQWDNLFSSVFFGLFYPWLLFKGKVMLSIVHAGTIPMVLVMNSHSAKEAAQKRAAFAKSGEHIPPFLIASITSICNLHCAGCYARHNQSCGDSLPVEQLSDQEWLKIFEEARALGISFILLAGGEPMIRRDVIGAAGTVPEILFLIFTNGTMIDDAYIGLFDQYRNLVPVFSIEGHREKQIRAAEKVFTGS